MCIASFLNELAAGAITVCEADGQVGCGGLGNYVVEGVTYGPGGGMCGQSEKANLVLY